MDLTPAAFGPDTVAMMGRICDEVWNEIQSNTPSTLDESEIRSQLARRVMAAIVGGEHDPQRLKAIAMGFDCQDSIDG